MTGSDEAVMMVLIQLEMREETAFVSERDTLIVMAAAYQDVADADADYEAVEAVCYEVVSSHDFDAAVLARDENGEVRVVKKDEHQPATAPCTGSAGVSQSGSRARSSRPSASSVDPRSAAAPARRLARSPGI
jgi:hypothetical protein